MIAVPVFGYKSHIAIDRRFGFIREGAVTSATEADGRMLRRIVTTDNTSGEVWADSAYRSQSNEKWLAANMLNSRIHRRKPAGKPMPPATARANGRKSSIRARIEHVFAHQKNRFGLFIRTIGLARAEAKLTLANLAYNMDRLIFHERGRPRDKSPGKADIDPGSQRSGQKISSEAVSARKRQTLAQKTGLLRVSSSRRFKTFKIPSGSF